MIADEELRSLFKIECEERLQHLDDGLLRLEKIPADPPLLEDLFREAHSLKGAARMMGLNDIQTLAHHLEDALGAAKKGEASLSKDAVAEMFQTLDTIRGLVREAVSEQPIAAQSNANFGLQNGESTPENTASQAPPETPTAATHILQSEDFRIETIRVDPKKLDALLTQAGELIVTKIRIAHRHAEIEELLDYCEGWYKAVHAGQLPEDAEGLISSYLESLQAMLNRMYGSTYEDSARLGYVADQLESGIRNLRLLPMSTLFVLFPRLVHDLSRDQHKEIELVMEGEDTVADKRVLEEMKDPLMHMLRNAIDHGIESPEQREQAGKSRAGTIRIRASQTPSSVVIEVMDDGRGLDLDEIKRIAQKRGMYPQEELAEMSAAQIQALILVPGFSTSNYVTDVSGRGVGLDVVCNNVERLKGELQIESTQGKGLTLRAQLPISLATVRVLIVAVSGHRYALPVEFVQFLRKLLSNEVYKMEGR